MNLTLEALTIPVSDVDRAKAFYENLGFRLDGDFAVTDEYRAVQLTPPASGASIQFGTGVTSATPGSAEGLLLVTDDVEVARTYLIERGAHPSAIFHGWTALFAEAGEEARLPGLHPERASYGSYLSFADPDGNAWLVQEVGERLPGRLWPAQEKADTTAVMLDLLRMAAVAHGRHEAQDLGGVFDEQWPEWYAEHMTRELAEHGYALVRAEEPREEASNGNR